MISSLIDELEQIREKLPDIEAKALQNEKSELVQKTLYDISQFASDAEDLPAFYKNLHASLADLVYVENFFIAIYNNADETVKFVYFQDKKDKVDPTTWDPKPLSELENTLTAQIIRARKPMFITRDDMEKQVRDNKLDEASQVSHQWVGIPLISDQELLGVMVTQSYDQEFEYSISDRALLNYVGQHIASALFRRQSQDLLKDTNLVLEEKVKRRTKELEKTLDNLKIEIEERTKAESLQSILYRIAEQASKEQSSLKFYSNIHNLINELVEAPNFFIAVLNEERNKLIFEYRMEDDENPILELDIDFGKSLDECTPTEHVLLTGKSLLMGPHNIDQFKVKGRAAESWLGIPLLHDDQSQGVMVVQTFSKGARYDEQSRELLVFVSQNVTNAIMRQFQRRKLDRAHLELRKINAELELRVEQRTEELKKLLDERQAIQDKLAHDAMHDALTGAPNRALFLDRLETALLQLDRKDGFPFSVMFLDLDRFKIINDSMGHSVGDQLLIQVIRRLNKCVRPGDTVARMGGDEFCILLPRLKDDKNINQVCNRILNALALPFYIDQREIFTSTSIGVTLCELGHRSAEMVLRDADAAMYEAKSAGKNRYVMFTKEMHEAALRHIRLETHLRHSIEKDEIKVFYQPILSVESEKIATYEALVRWQHPEFGLVNPMEFIPIAEEIGFIHELGLFVLDQSLKELQFLLKQGIQVSVNLSSRQFESETLVTDITEIVANHNVRPELINLEVTEGLLISDFEVAKSLLEKLQNVGFNIMLDDFGTGYSSLSYLHRLPIDTLKTDRSFMSENFKEQEPLLKSIAILAQQLGINVIAEGIETREHLDFIKALEIDKVQGFYFDKPKPINEIKKSSK